MTENGTDREVIDIRPDDDEGRREAVRDLPDPERDQLTREDLDVLRDAGLGELAEIGEQYVRA